MNNILLVGCGGFVGSVARFIVSGAINRFAALESNWPGTLLVNILGCFAIGVIVGAGEQRYQISHELRLLLVTGVLGGFTTFSAFSLEATKLTQSDSTLAALLYIGASVIFGIAATIFGLSLSGISIWGISFGK